MLSPLYQIMKESIPHLYVLRKIKSPYLADSRNRVASITSIMLSTAWSIYMIIRDLQFKSDFQQVITNEACGGVSLLPDFWGVRWGLDVRLCISNLHIGGALTLLFIDRHLGVKWRRSPHCIISHHQVI